MSMPELFHEKLREERKTCKVNSLTLSKLKYDLLIDKVRLLKAKVRKEGNDYRFLKRYGIIEVNGIERLISPVTESGEIRYFVHDDELFEILNRAHTSTGHGGRDRMKNNLKTKFTNITYKDIMLYLSLCERCSEKQKHLKRGVCHTAKPISLKEIHSRCRVDVIDFQSHPDGDYNFVLVYQDETSKFVVLRPLKTKTTEEICENVVDIFTLFGAPSVLRSDNAKELVEKITNGLRSIWPNFKMVYGEPNQNDGHNEEIENLIEVWMRENQTSRWARDLKYIQAMKNGAPKRAESKETPYEALFGCRPKCGLASFNFSDEISENVKSEEDLERFVADMRTEESSNSEKVVGDDDRFVNPEREMDDCFVTYVDKSVKLEIRKRTEQTFDPLSQKPKRTKNCK